MGQMKIKKPKEGEYYIFGDNLLKVVSAKNCENCFFYTKGYCELMFSQNGNVHCDYDSGVNFKLKANISDFIL